MSDIYQGQLLQPPRSVPQAGRPLYRLSTIGVCTAVDLALARFPAGDGRREPSHSGPQTAPAEADKMKLPSRVGFDESDL